MGAFSKEQTHVETCQPEESPRLGGAEAPPFGKGGFGAHSKGSLAKGSWQKSLIFD